MRTTTTQLISNIDQPYHYFTPIFIDLGVKTIAILETIMAANASYAVIKKCLQNGSEVKDMITHVGRFLTAEDQLKEQVRKKKASPLTAITGGEEGDWECFQQLEDIREKRRELESWTRLYAKPGTWQRWLNYQQEARVARRAAEKQAEKDRQEKIEAVSMVAGIVIAAAVVLAGIYFIAKFLGKI
ncbi:MAG: hypothetical protein CMO97_06050 [Woeseia sp.]|nr:hypothetical protein [Woeseia sp.]